MKKVVALSFIILLILSGCSNDVENSTSNNDTSTKKNNLDTIYHEEAIDCWPKELFSAKQVMQYHYPKMDTLGKLFEIEQEYVSSSEKNIHLTKVKLENNSWKKVDIPWAKKLEKQLKSKNVVVDRYAYSNAGDFYIMLSEYPMYPPQYYDNPQESQNKFYPIDQYCFRIDEAKNTVERVKLPTVNAKKYYESVGSDLSNTITDEKQIMKNDISILGNGNIFVASSDTSVSGLYHGKSGEKVKGGLDAKGIAAYYSETAAGYDFLVIAALNTAGEVVVNVYSETGELLNSLPTDITCTQEQYNAGTAEYVSVGVSGEDILLATKDGIYKANVKDKKFENIINSKNSKLYYLSNDNQLCKESLIFQGEMDDYYVAICQPKTSEMDKTFLCHYKKMGE